MHPKVFFPILLVSVTSALSLAQVAGPVHLPTVPQQAPTNSAEQKKLDFVLNWWREVIDSRHTELAAKYQAEDYIQHNPNVPTGRAAFVEFFSSRGRAITPILATLKNSPVVEGAKNNFVWLVFEHPQKDPQDASKSLYGYSFELLRIQNGKVQEHWDSARKSPGSPIFVPTTSPPPAKWAIRHPTAGDRHNLAIATRLAKDVLQYGHVELLDTILAPDFIEHNPNIPPTGQGLKQFLSNKPDHTTQVIRPQWKQPPVLSFVNGPYVVMMWEHKDSDPSDVTREYVRNSFAVFRIEGHLIKESWE